MTVAGCPFCLDNGLFKTSILATSDNAYLTDAQTVFGDYLIIPKGHIEDLDNLPKDWWSDVMQLLAQLPNLLDFNISINIGEQAGQKLKHLHFWVIPRHAGKLSSGKGMAALITEADSIGSDSSNSSNISGS